MNITLMEKVYKDNSHVLYINGLVGAISEDTFVESVREVLESIGYNITDVNYILSLNDDIPNNESDYWNESGEKTPVHVIESKWTHHCKKGCCFDTGYKLAVNGIVFNTDHSISIELLQILERLGHPISLDKRVDNSPNRPGLIKGSCLEYLNDPLERQYIDFKNRNLSSKKLNDAI